MSYKGARSSTFDREGPVRPFRRRHIKFTPLSPPIRRPDPDVELVRSGRVASKRKVESTYQYLNNRAATATSFGELDQLKTRNGELFNRLRETKWMSLAQEKFSHCNEVIRKRYDELRKKESLTKVGVGVTKGPGPIVGGSGVFEKRTSKEPPTR